MKFGSFTVSKMVRIVIFCNFITMKIAFLKFLNCFRGSEFWFLENVFTFKGWNVPKIKIQSPLKRQKAKGWFLTLTYWNWLRSQFCLFWKRKSASKMIIDPSKIVKSIIFAISNIENCVFDSFWEFECGFWRDFCL